MVEFMKNQRFGYLAGMVGVVALSGCHVDQWQQPKVKYDQASDFYSDGQGNRPLVAGTVPVGGLRLDKALFEGKLATGKPVPQIPAGVVTAIGGPTALLDRGENRYNVYCAPCHGAAGDGNGFIAQRGLGFWQKLPVSLHQPRLRKVEDGYMFDVISHGKGVMYGYAARIPDPNDRWAVVSYVRVLQAAAAERSGQPHEISAEPVPAPTPIPEEPVAVSVPATPDAEVKKAQRDIDAVLSGMTGDVLFDTGKTTIKPAASAFLNKLAAVLIEDAGVAFEIGGHTDAQGSLASNKTLSDGRAKAVRNYLTAKGIAGSRLTAKGYGSTRPVADNGSAQGRAKNRRITFTASAGGAK